MKKAKINSIISSLLIAQQVTNLNITYASTIENITEVNIKDIESDEKEPINSNNELIENPKTEDTIDNNLKNEEFIKNDYKEDNNITENNIDNDIENNEEENDATIDNNIVIDNETCDKDSSIDKPTNSPDVDTNQDNDINHDDNIHGGDHDHDHDHNEEVVEEEAIIFIDENFEKMIRNRIWKPEGEVYESDLKYITSLAIFSSDKIYSLADLKHFKNLEQLEIEYPSNKFDFTSLSNAKKIRFLTIIGATTMQNIDFAKDMPELEVLFLRTCTKLENIDGIKDSQKLRRFELTNSSIENLDALNSIPSLENIYLSNNNNVSNTINLENLSKLNDLTILKRGEQEFIAPTSLRELSITTDILSEKNLNSLDRYEQLSTLTVTNKTKLSLDGIENLKGLNTLNITGYDKSELDGKDFKKICEGLKNINIANERIVNQNEFATPDSIESLSMENMNIKNIDLSNIGRNIDSIIFENCTIPNINTNLNLNKLSTVSINRCNKLSNSEYSNLMDASKDTLKYLSLENCSLSDNDVQFISNLNLNNLNLSYNNITNIEFIKNQTNITDLYINDNQIKDISIIDNFKNLGYINISDNQISDISVLMSGELNNLHSIFSGHNYIDISNEEIRDFICEKDYFFRSNQFGMFKIKLNNMEDTIKLEVNETYTPSDIKRYRVYEAGHEAEDDLEITLNDFTIETDKNNIIEITSGNTIKAIKEGLVNIKLSYKGIDSEATNILLTIDSRGENYVEEDTEEDEDIENDSNGDVDIEDGTEEDKDVNEDEDSDKEDTDIDTDNKENDDSNNDENIDNDVDTDNKDNIPNTGGLNKIAMTLSISSILSSVLLLGRKKKK